MNLIVQITATLNKSHANVALYNGARDLGWLFFENGELKRATTKAAKEAWDEHRDEIVSLFKKGE